MQFVTLVRLRPSPTGTLPIEREPGIYEAEWSRLSEQMQLVGAKIQSMLNVLGNGFEAKTHPAVGAEEYARLVHEIANIVHKGGYPSSTVLDQEQQQA